MRRFRWVVLASLGFCVAELHGADATSPIDYQDRNAPFRPASTVPMEKRVPEIQNAIQDKRVTPETIDKKPAALGDRRAAIDLKETQPKTIQEKSARQPERLEQPVSRYDRKLAGFSTSEDTKKPPTVSKYQDSLAAASAANMARFPAISGTAKAKLNRFIFRKNGGDLVESPPRAVVVPAAGGSAPVK